MAVFEYKARTREGETRTGVITSSSKEAALDALQKTNLLVLSILQQGKPSVLEMKVGGGVRQKDLVIFSRQLSTLFEAHVPVASALKILIDQTTREGLKKSLLEILDDVTGGLNLSQAMGKHPKIFSSFYVNLVRSGEESGKLQEVFSYLADYMERSYYLVTKVRNALIYPAFVLIAFFAVMIVMLVVVFPRLLSIFQASGQQLPFATQIIIDLSLFLQNWGIILLILLIIGVFFTLRWRSTTKGRYFFDRIQVSTPVLGSLYRRLYMARMTDNLQTLITSAIPILRALAITGDVVDNVIYKKALNDAIESVKAGNTISAAFEKVPEIPPMVTQMIRIGESTGRLDFILGKISKFYQTEVDSAVENLVALIEPILIIVLGIGVGILVGSVLVPLYNLVSAY